ncbi:DUF1003 domain-containing protein [Luteibacter pinisoli]|uniref:DUF1003 domain-containing protein n=1 Tax=Luteibacter pinisoli TaxID=2589080 RepID=A0A4Y5Z1K7_9GAMM|nr:DUF1003 domain-containing protein [Luteibacter pinisoli]QDE39162.1 DUF1003 domain-containing protein [Luteibacter pinisoli]
MATIPPSPEHAAHRWFAKGLDDLGHAERHLLDHLMQRKLVAENINEAFRDDMSFGERLADKVSRFGGSWTFIIVFAAILAAWTGLNSYILHRPFDPYPYIFLNLLLSMLAAIQAPVIMMSQNRQAAKDRMDATNDYKVNLKAEIEIMGLHEKLDQMRNDQLEKMLMKQQEQIDLLLKLVREQGE